MVAQNDWDTNNCCEHVTKHRGKWLKKISPVFETLCKLCLNHIKTRAASLSQLLLGLWECAREDQGVARKKENKELNTMMTINYTQQHSSALNRVETPLFNASSRCVNMFLEVCLVGKTSV